MPAGFAGSLRAEADNCVVKHLASDIRTLEDHCPVATAFRWAADHDPVDIAQHQTDAVQSMRIGKIGHQTECSGRDTQRPVHCHWRPALVDNELIYDRRAAPPG